MQTEKITLEQLRQMDLPEVIIYAAPVMFALVMLEWFISFRKNHKTYVTKEFFSASAIGLVNVGISALLKFSTFAIVLFFYNLSPLRIPFTWWSFPLCLIAIDFCRYWAHRVAHEQRMWWATHVTHHSSENYNFAVSFRLSWTQHIKLIFFLPVALMGFHPVVFFICHQIEVLYQFWIHTEYIGKLHPVIEYIFTTPSHHRVHHARNEKYLDKNYGSTLIIWDRMFGTFQAEEEKPEYGITEPVNSYNPVYLVFHEWVDIVRDLGSVRSPKEAWNIMFGRPADKVKFRQLVEERKKIKKPA
ncbi:sterol desaturase family protein [Roseivirga sp. BDSF3-8]|uniref:sterol desaturase family protein n=1 Tax=Roseivirga sp. BDSF3-8 TaxID=3241598 RepID=UPI003531A813